MIQKNFTQNLARAAMLLLLAVLTSVGAWADEAEDLSTPLTLEAKTAGAKVTFSINTQTATKNVEYRTGNGTEWTAWAVYTSEQEIQLVNEGDMVQFRGENMSYSYHDESHIQCTDDCYIYGNIMSLTKKEGFSTEKKLESSYNFYELFLNNQHIINHESKDLMLPATTLAKGCYEYMFIGCTGLTRAPALPATTLAEWCYSDMFAGCTSLENAPALPATTLAEGCYSDMFVGCTSLTEAPLLPAATLVQDCYAEMFAGCENLSSVTCYATDIDATNCTNQWLSGVASEGTFNKADGMDKWTENSTSGIPTGWTATASYNSVPLTFQARVNGAKVTFTLDDGVTGVEYRTWDGIEWTEWTDYTSGQEILLENEGDKVQFRGENMSYSYNDESHIQCSDDCYVYGNIMSLIKAEGFAAATTLDMDSNFTELFRRNTHIDILGDDDNNPLLVLPATTLSPYCYAEMFEDCTGLTKVPALPATTLAYECYISMFEGCTGLTTVPTDLLPATTLADECYESLFDYCTSLKNVPDLPATTLADYCYNSMFDGCTSLTTVPAELLPATELTGYCYQYMFYNCTSLENAPALPATTLAEYCYDEMFEGCTNLKNAPAILPATTMYEGCYWDMFSGCKNLENAPVLPATELATYCYKRMFQGCAKVDRIVCLATDISANECTCEWVDGVAEKGVFYKAKGMEDWTIGINGIPEGWTVKENEYEVPNMAAGTYATFYFDDDVTLSVADEELKFYTVSSVGTDVVVLTEIENKAVPAKTPFIIYNAGTGAKTFSLVMTSGLTLPESVTVYAGFKGTAEEKEMPASTASKNYYVLRNNAFAWVKSAGTIPANRCWLELGSNAARQLNIVFGDATAIRPTPNPSLNGGEWYDLQGRKIVHGTSSNSTLRKGIYIQNGQKVVK